MLAAYKRPRAYRFVSELPMTATGKVMRRELRESLGRAAAARNSEPDAHPGTGRT